MSNKLISLNSMTKFWSNTKTYIQNYVSSFVNNKLSNFIQKNDIINSFTSTDATKVAAAPTVKTLNDNLNQLNTKTDPQDIEISLGPKFTGNAYAKKVGYIIMIDMELTPSSSVVNNDLVMSGLPAPTGGAFYTALTTGNGNYTAIIKASGELRIYFPGYTDASRIDCGLCYICA